MGCGSCRSTSAVFGYEPHAQAIGEAHIFDQPLSGGERFGGESGRIPQEFGAFVLDPGGGQLEDFAFVDLDQQIAIPHCEQQRVTFLIFLVDVPIFDGLIVHAEQGLGDRLPGDRLVFVGGEGGPAANKPAPIDKIENERKPQPSGRRAAISARAKPAFAEDLRALRGRSGLQDDNSWYSETFLGLDFGKGFVEEANGLVDVALGDIEHGREADDIAV